MGFGEGAGGVDFGGVGFDEAGFDGVDSTGFWGAGGALGDSCLDSCLGGFGLGWGLDEFWNFINKG